MVAVRLEGRLGNQLFQYAFIYTTAKKLGTGFYLDKSIYPFLLPRYFKVDNDFTVVLDRSLFSIKGFGNFFTKNLNNTFYKLIRSLAVGNNIVDIDYNEPAYLVTQSLKDKCLYQGFFQSATYFVEYKEQITELFEIKQKYKLAFKQLYQQFEPSVKKVVVHVRRSDYVYLGWQLPLAYYKKAIEHIGHNNTKYIFISDDVAYIEQEFAYVQDKYISKNAEIIDFQFLINADICILSNSSFSWWGAWLNKNKNKQVIAPKNWLGFGTDNEIPLGISENLDFTLITL